MGTKKSLLNFETFYWIEKNISGPLLVSRTGEGKLLYKKNIILNLKKYILKFLSFLQWDAPSVVG